MGLNSSKTHPRVTKVAPMPSKEDPQQLHGRGDLQGFQSPLQGWNVNSFTSITEKTPVLERHLPPLRETWLGRYPAGPRPDPSCRVEVGATSIIKQHPPRRFPKLEPLLLATDITSDMSWSRQNKARGLEKRAQDMTHPVGSRQHFHKMKVLEMRQEAEERRRHQREMRLCHPKSRDLNARRLQRDNSSDEDLPTIEHDQTFNDDYGDPWDEELLKGCGLPESHRGPNGKVERWLLKQQTARESFWDASSTDSENWDSNSGKPLRRPALVRTKTERIPLFDEFFD